LLVSVSPILLVGLPCWTTFLLVSLEDKLMPIKRERVSRVGNAECLTQSPVLNSEDEKHKYVSSNWYNNFKRSMQNLGKDILKNFGWLDLGRKVYPREDGLHIRLPITEKFSVMILIKQGHDGDAFEEG